MRIVLLACALASSTLVGCASSSPGYHGGGGGGAYYRSGAGGTVPVRGYFRSNGTYVAPHYQTAPDGIR